LIISLENSSVQQQNSLFISSKKTQGSHANWGINGRRVGMRPFLALCTASVIPAAFHPFKMVFFPFSPRRNLYCYK